MKLVIDIHKKDYQSILNSGQVPYGVVCAIMNGTPLESYLPNERCDTCKYVDCSIDNEPCIDCKVPHKSFYEPRLGLEGEVIDKAIIEADKEG